MAIFLWILAGWLRTRGLATATVLSDQMGPWWVAVEGPPWLEPHAPPYGWGLYWPYWLLLGPAENLWTAVTGLLWMHALLAPIAFATAWMYADSGNRWIGSVLIGLAVPMEPGLIDTALSGSKTYLAVIWVGFMVLGLVARRRRWGPILASVAFAMAVMNHPLSVCTAPMFLCLSLGQRRVQMALLLAVLLLLPSGYWLATHSIPGTGELQASVGSALFHLWETSPWSTCLALGGVVLGFGLGSGGDRRLVFGVMISGLLLALVGYLLGYVRDYHFRLLILPALLGWVRLSGPWPLLGVLFLRIPVHPIEQPSRAVQPGSLGLAHMFTNHVEELSDSRVVIDRAWIGASPAAEPSAITLDLWLRGRPVDGFGPGGTVILIVSAERGEGQLDGEIDDAIAAWPNPPLLIGDRYFLARGQLDEVRAWSADICQSRGERGLSSPRLGGAWDGLIVLQPQLTSETLMAWWDCP